MLKKISLYIKDSALTFFTNMLTFIKNNKLILLGCVVAVISVIVFKVYQMPVTPELIETHVQKTGEISNKVDSTTLRQQIHSAQYRQDLECASIRVMLKKRDPRISIPRLEWKLEHASTPRDKENIKRAIECFKQRPGVHDGEIETYLRNKPSKR